MKTEIVHHEEEEVKEPAMPSKPLLTKRRTYNPSESFAGDESPLDGFSHKSKSFLFSNEQQ